jgi:DNA-binding SARP family transcriptional activator/pimeloyl-ACP methyl ester carboxylesterase
MPRNIAAVRVSVLGPVQVRTDRGEVGFGAAKERSLLAVLAVNAGVVVSQDALINALWGDAPPATARKTLQTYVSNLRRALGADMVATDPTGYALRVDREAVDVVCFRKLLREGDDAARAGATDRAREKFVTALALWRGQPFGGVALHTGLAAEAVRLEEEYLSALERRFDAELATGRHAQLVGELELAVREHPFRERLWGCLMLALYRSGRQADALAAYERVRVLLREELGLEPGGELRRIEHAVLGHEETAGGDADAGAVASRGERRPFRSSVRYALASDGTHIAYEIVGNGPIDVLAVPGFVSHLDMWWDAPTDALVRRLAAFSRLILFDKRGMGLSDRRPEIDVEDWVEDTNAVIEAADSQRPVVLGISAGAPTAALFAARFPERVRALVLYGGYARFLRADDYAIGASQPIVDAFIDRVQAEWGTGVGLSVLAPSLTTDAAARQFWARLQTRSASPSAAASFLRALAAVDIRDALPNISVPTLIVHAQRDASTPIEGARLCRDLIPDAKLVELDTDIHLIWLSDLIGQITDEIEAFVSSTVLAPSVEPALATILAVAPAGALAGSDAPLARVVKRHGGRMPATPGIALFDRPGRAIECGLSCAAELAEGSSGVGVAVHSGECLLTTRGVEGYAAVLATHVARAAAPGEVLVTQTIRDLLAGTPMTLASRGCVASPDDGTDWQVFAVVPQVV